MRVNIKVISGLVSMLLITACVSVPNGPSTMALPGTNKTFDQFRYDDASCRGFAHAQIGGTSANQAAGDSFLKSAVTGTVIGAALGAAMGRGGDAGAGAATGLFVGSIMGAEAANVSAYGAQQRYDNAYVQCVYAKGHRVPVSGHIEQQPVNRMPPPRYIPPPPPPGYIAPPQSR
jgi:hypothetical protein